MAREITLRGGVRVSEQSPVFVIAEIGQNHQGDIGVAKELIRIAKDCGVNCVKFQKTCLKEKFAKSALNREYAGENSWGKTYGEHKDFLEFSEDEFRELQRYSGEVGVLFTASAMDSASLKFLKEIDVPFIKIGSGDADNFILIEEAAKMDIALVISTGMQTMETVKKIHEIVSRHHRNFALMHCVSSYPTPVAEINLKVIPLFKETFPGTLIGYSGHELGTEITAAAVAIGAKIIERHITLDHSLKGSDHKSSLEPEELRAMIERIRTVEMALGKPIKERQGCELPCYEKLGKSVVASRDLSRGHVLTLDDVKIKVAEPRGMEASLLETVLGRKLSRNVGEDEAIVENDFE